MFSSRGSNYGGIYNRSSGYDYPNGSLGGYDLGGVWRPHTGRSEVVFNDHSDYYRDLALGHYYPSLMSAYDSNLLGNYYHSPYDYYGSYHSLGLYEEQLRMMRNLSHAEKLALWQSRLQFEELCEEERAIRYQMMAEEERMTLGLVGSSYWGSRYSGLGYDFPLVSSRIPSWSSSRLPLSASLASRYRPLYSLGYNDYGTGYNRGSGYAGSASGYGIGRSRYGLGSVSCGYGGSGRLGITTGSMASNMLKAQVDEAKRMRRHAREASRQARRHLMSY